MKFTFQPILSIGLLLLCTPIKNFGQTLNLGSIESFAICTVVGGVSNIGNSTIKGKIGTNSGSIGDFNAPTTVNGSVENGNTLTEQAKIDLLNVYIILNNIPVTNTTHGAAFTNETVTPGVYLTGSAGSFGGTLTLDGGNDPNAVFIFKFEGALSGNVGTTMVLTNGARSCNVFWLGEGAISAGTNSVLKGTFIAHPGAVTMGTGCNLDGRMLSTSGALTLESGIVTKPTGLSTIPISCVNTCINPILKSVANFALFSSAGVVGNTGISGLIGDVGSNAGDVSGWATSIVIGTVQSANSVTAQAKIDLLDAYTQLFNTPATNSTHAAAFGGGETLFPGVYSIASAGSLAGTLILDGRGSADAVFIFKIGAAFSAASQSKVILINGARRCNIFWIAEGAITMGEFTFMKGSLIANNGACNMGANGFLEGRMLSTAGSVNFNTATTYVGTSLCADAVMPVEFISFTGKCEQQKIMLNWTVAYELNNKNFIVESSIDGSVWETVGSVASTGNSSLHKTYSFVDKSSIKAINYYRLKQTDFDDKIKYSKIIKVDNCSGYTIEKITVFPNPSTGQVNILLTENPNQVFSTEIFNVDGAKVYQSNTYKSQIDLSGKAAGVYLIRVLVNSKIINSKFVIQK